MQTTVTKMLSCAQLQALEMSVTVVISRERRTGSFMLLAFTPAFLIMSQVSLFVLCGAQSHPLFGGCGALRFYRFSFCSQQPCFQLVVKIVLVCFSHLRLKMATVSKEERGATPYV